MGGAIEPPVTRRHHLAADEDLGADTSVFAPLFGVPKATIPVLSRLAKQCDAAVVPCIACYDETERCYVTRLLDLDEDFTAYDDAQSALRMNAAIELTVQQCLAQYFWTLRLFKTRPEGEEPVYVRR